MAVEARKGVGLHAPVQNSVSGGERLKAFWAHYPHLQLGSAVKKVLIVEDQADIRELIRVTLELEPYELHEAEDGLTGLTAAQRLKPDLLLLDVMMPGAMDGLEVCRRVRATSELRRTRIVMLTAKGQAGDKSAGLAAGADEYLIKPFSPLDLMKIVSKMIG